MHRHRKAGVGSVSGEPLVENARAANLETKPAAGQ